jgi:uncharacterized protein YjbI with pentapeptide repeats
VIPDLAPIAAAHDPRLAVVPVRFRYGQRRFATIVAKLVLRLIDGAPAILLPPEPIVARDEHYDDSPIRSVRRPSEVAPRLLATDVLLTGNAFQPLGNPGTTRVVGLGLHRGGESLLYKTLYVYGDRSTAEPDKVRPFAAMPLVWERAFGGAGIDANPVGLNPADPGVRSLPNLIDPRGSTIPAGYGPLSRYWPVRSRLLGVTSQATVAGTALELPEGFPFAFFHAAPPEQRVRFLAGDEWLVLDGLHPLAARIQSKLPGLRAVARVHGPGGSVVPVQMMLDMAVIEADRAICSLVFRGMTDAAVDGSVFAVALDVPQSPVDWPDPRAAVLVSEPVPARPQPTRALDGTLSMDDDAQGRAASTAAAPYPLPQPRAGTVADLPGAPWAKPSRTVVIPVRGDEPTMPLDLRDAPPEVRALLDGPLPPAPEAPIAPPAEPPPAPPPASFRELAPPVPSSVEAPVSSIPELETGVRRMVLEKVRAGEALFGADLSGADLSGLDLTNAVLADANLAGAKLVGAVLSGARLTGAKLMGADLRRASLDRADLSRADLSRACLAESSLEDASLLDVTAPFVDGQRALLTRSRLERAKLMQASLEGAVLDDAHLAEAELTGASLSRVSASSADFTGARLGDARLDNANLTRAKLCEADLSGASLRDALLEEVDATRARLERATLDGARMARAKLSGADLRRATLSDIRAEAAILDGVDLSHCVGDRAQLARVTLTKADLRHARLPQSTFAGADLAGAQAQKLLANEANFEAADLRGASFRSARMKGAKLRGAKLHKADFRDADVSEVDWTGVEKEGASWAGAKM